MRIFNALMLLVCLPLMLLGIVYITIWGLLRVLFWGDTIRWENPVNWKTVRR